jgi:hypothetical protein
LNNLQQFAPLLAQTRKGERSVTGDDEQNPASVPDDSKGVDPDIVNAERLFAGKRFTSGLLPFTPPDKSGFTGYAGPRLPASVAPGVPVVQSATLSDRGMQRWEKVLSKTDAQRQEGNPTGDIRLTQAKWKVNGRPIDQTTYFRNGVFREADWHRKNADVEEAPVEFNVNILGTDYGQHTLVVSQKPSGEASQGNYTTGIQWRDLMPVIRRIDLTGRTLRLYDPPARSIAFVLEIV